VDTNPLGLLLRLQAIDRDFDEKARLYESVKQQIVDRSELTNRRRAHGRLADELSTTKGKLRDSELELDGLQERARKVKADLYSGRIRSPKELENLHRDSEYLRRRVSQLEDRVLLALTQADDLEETAKQSGEDLRTFETEWQQTHQSLMVQYETLRTRLKQLQQTRGELRGQLGRAELGLYDELRAKKAGIALSPMRDRVCQTCRVRVPTHKAQMVRSRQGIVACEGCGRILYPG